MVSMEAPLVSRLKIWFLRRFSSYRIAEHECERLFNLVQKHADNIAALRKQAKSDAAVLESLNRYIEALEGRDKERLKRIDELENVCCEALEFINELRGQLSGIAPQEKTLKEVRA